MMIPIQTKTTGKQLVLRPAIFQARIDRLATSKGDEFNRVRRLFVGLGAQSSPARRYAEWARQRNVRLFTFTGSFDATVKMFNEGGIDGIVTSPFQLLKYARQSGGQHRFSYILSTGAPIDAAACRKIRSSLLVDGGAMYASYGASEVGTIALASAADIESGKGYTVLPDVDIGIDDGEIVVATPTMAEGVARGGYYHTADHGRLTQGGGLAVAGRIPAHASESENLARNTNRPT